MTTVNESRRFDRKLQLARNTGRARAVPTLRLRKS